MPKINAIQIADNQYIYVEVDENVDDTSLPKSTSPASTDWQPTGPENASSCGPVDDAIDALQTLQNNIGTLANTVYDSFKSHQPDEWTLELNVGFKGKTSPIPVILSGEASGAIKVTAKWKKASS